MKLRSLEYILAAYTLPKGMEWLDTRLSYHQGKYGAKTTSLVLTKDGRYHQIDFSAVELKGLKLTWVTTRIRNEIALFEADLKSGDAKVLKVEKGIGIK